MKVIHKIGLMIPAGAAALMGCGGEKSDPSTASKSDLNPPGYVWTVTQDKKIELRWSAGNVEDSFKGYYVFVAKKADYDSKGGAAGVAYPAGANVAATGIPRCADNTKFWEAFGLPASTTDCDGGDEENKPGTGGEGTTLTGRFLEGEDGAAEGDADAKLTGWVKCDENTGTEPSLAVTPPAVSYQTCTISKDAAGAALANGTVYGFVVVAVMGDDLSDISWSSNLVWDAPSATAVASDTSLDLAASEMAKLTFDVTAGTATLGAAAACSGATPCGLLSVSNSETVSTPTIFLSRADATAGGSYKQRLYISASSGGKVKIQPRGPQTWDPQKGQKAPRIPGDEAADSFPAAGTKYVVYNNQVFDYEIEDGAKKYYGKVVVGDVNYGSATDATTKATLKLTVVHQPAAGLSYYIK